MLAGLLLLAGAVALVVLVLWAVFAITPECYELVPADLDEHLVGPSCPPAP